MKTLFLTSSVNFVAQDIASKINQSKYKRLAFIDTAAEGEDGEKQWLQDDRDALVRAGFDVFTYTLTNKNEQEIKNKSEFLERIHCE